MSGHKIRPVLVCGVMLGLLATATRANEWRLADAVQIHPTGTQPSLFNGRVAYLDFVSGAVMYYDGEASHLIYAALLYNHEPINTNNGVAWRNRTGSSVATNEILLWDGTFPVTAQNISNTPNIVESDIAAGSNGDVMWSRNHAELYYYTAATGVAAPLGIAGELPSLYITPDGTATYAWQNPTTDDIFYFDGETTHLLGRGAVFGGRPSVWNGMVAWVGESEVGTYFTTGEIYYWKNGVTHRLTNDDAIGGRADDFPKVWNDTIVWQRSPTNPMARRIYFWDGQQIWPLSTDEAKYPSYHDGQVAYEASDGLYLARLEAVVGACCVAGGQCLLRRQSECLALGGVYQGHDTLCDPSPCPPPLGNPNCDLVVDVNDIPPFILALIDPAAYAAAYPGCDRMQADVNQDGQVDGRDVAPFAALLLGQ